MTKTKLYYVLILTLLAAGTWVAPLPAAESRFQLDRFIDPGTCGDCHGDIFAQWQQSMHHLSHNDPIYTSVAAYLLQGLTDANEIAEGESCVKCHTPIGYITGYPLNTSDDRTKVSELAAQGIQCDYCHSAVDTEKMYNNGLRLAPGNGEDDPGVKRGPFTNSESDFHETAYSDFHTRSEICGTCHNVKHVAFGTDLETTYDEWKNGPYYSKDDGKVVQCQDCHMYQRPGIPATGSTKRPRNPGFAADDGPSREHIFTHYFVGANSFVPGQFGNKGKAQMAEERLKNAATLAIDTDNLGDGVVNIIVTNTGAGHKLPTGLTDVRQMWLEIIVKDDKGNMVVSSGLCDTNGYIPEDAVVYNTIFGDGRGKPVSNISKAREILKDKRILPKQYAKETVALPHTTGGDLNVTARLLYRSAPQKLLDSVLKDKSIRLPVIVMAEAQKTITIKKGEPTP